MRRMKMWGLAALAGLMVGLLGCGGGDTSKPGGGGSTSKPSGGSTKPTDSGDKKTSSAAPTGWGTVTGKITWKGEKPKLPPPKVDKDQASCPATLPNEEFVINDKNQGVANVFVWLVEASDPKKPKAPPIHPDLKEVPKKEVVIDQPACKFEPHALAFRQGQTLVIKNSANILHNSQWEGGEGEGANPSIPPGKEERINVKDASYTPFTVKCGVHPWMRAHFRVFDHPYFAVTNADGEFKIEKAPAGKYNIVIWHENKGWVNGGKAGQPIEIKADGSVDASTTMGP